MVLANSGSALMFATTVHLLIGNLLIGIVEGSIVAKLFKTPRRKSVVIITIANYASAWLGTIGLGFSSSQIDFTIESAKLFVAVALIASFVITLLIEMPFLFWITNDENPSRKTLWKNLIFIHLVSYSLFIIPWYFTFSSFSLLKLKVVEAEEIVTDPLLIAYLSPDRQKAILYNLSQSKEIETFPANETFFNTSEKLLALEKYHHITPVGLDLKIPWKRWTQDGLAPLTAHRLENNESLKFKLDSRSNWSRGLVLSDPSRNFQQHFKLDTPSMTWPINQPTQIRDGLVLFQLGPDQICLADFRKMTIALLARGSRPVVVTKESDP